MVSFMSISSVPQIHQVLQDEQGGQDQLAPLGQKGTMALLENLDQRETLDHLVSSWAWNAGVCRWCAALGHGSRRAQIPPQEEEESHSQGGTRLFQGRQELLGRAEWGQHL